MISLDFKEAFDKIAHTYLFSILQSYGFSKGFIERIKHIYADVFSVVQVNGITSRPIPIHCSIRHGCPLSMALFTLCLNPFLHLLVQHLQEIRIQKNQLKTAMVAYADDVTILATSPEDIIAVRDAVQQYEKATGAVLNIHQSQALPVGTWDTKLPVMNISYTDEIKVLGFNMQKPIDQAGKASWARITNMIRTQAKETYGRNLKLVHRIQYVQVYLLAKLWHTAQVFPLPREYSRQIMSAIAWFIWQGAIFRVPISTLQRKKGRGIATL